MHFNSLIRILIDIENAFKKFKVGASKYIYIFFNEYFYSARMFYLSKVTVQTSIMLQRMSISNKYFSFKLSVQQKNNVA